MARFNPIQNAFVTGLMSARLRGRDDLAQYAQGMRQALNGIVQPHGGFVKRPGTYFVAEVGDDTDPVALLPFEVAEEQQYVLEFGRQYIRFFANQAVVEDPGSPGDPLEVATTYVDDQMRNLRHAQNADVMYLVHEDGYPYKLSRTAFDAFAWTPVEFKEGKAPMRPQNLTTTTITASGAGPVSYTLTFSAVHGLTTGNDVGRGVKLIHSSTNTVWYEITAVPSTTTLTVDRFSGTHDGTARTTWALGLFSNAEGPRCVTFHEGRLWYGGSRAVPDYLVGSVSDDFDNFDPGNGEDADRSIAKRVVGSKVNTVVWLKSQSSQLAVGTTGAEYRVFGANDDILTPTSTVLRPASARGSAQVEPELIDDSVIFVQHDRRALYEFKYQLQNDSFVSNNISLMSEDIYDSGSIQRLAYQQNPDSLMWAARGDGKVVGITYEPTQKVIGHHVHDFGGDVQDVVSITNLDGTADQLWLLTEYTIGGVTKQYISYMVDAFRPTFDQSRATDAEKIRALDDAFYVDCGLTLNNAKTIASISMANPVVITSTSHGFSNGDTVKIRIPRTLPIDTEDDGETDYNGFELDNLSATVANATANTFELSGVNGTAYSAYVSGGTVHKEVLSVSGLDHLNGRVVAVLADGAPRPNATVSGGAITLGQKASIVHVGLPYTYRGETQRFIGGGKIGTDQGHPTKIGRVAAILHNTLGLSMGTGSGTEYDLEAVQFRDGGTQMDRPPPLFTGEKEVPVEGGWNNDATVYFESTQPLPASVQAIMPRAQTNEG